jgi:hypothetical protein
MKQLFAIMLLCSVIFTGCSSSNGITNIQPRSVILKYRQMENSECGKMYPTAALLLPLPIHRPFNRLNYTE